MKPGSLRHPKIGARIALGFALFTCVAAPPYAAGQVGAGPSAVPFEDAIPQPHDRVFPGEIRLAVDATDTRRKIFSVRESVPVRGGAPAYLLYPRWDTASHAPTGSIGSLAGLTMRANGRVVPWTRDPANVFAFRVVPPRGATRLDLAFEFLSPPAPRWGALLMTPDVVTLPWQDALLYPAGWYARDESVRATLTLPAGFRAGTSLDGRRRAGGAIAYAPVSLETLVDSPVYAGRWFRRVVLRPPGPKPVALDLVADAPADLAISPAEIERTNRLLRETQAVFGPPHYRQYDFLVSLSDALPSDGGSEHLRSSENNFPADYLLHPAAHLLERDTIAHEYVHSWNGKFRTPADLWSPDFNTPSRDDLLWVYEGMTQYWSRVLAARAGERTRQATLDLFAVDADEALRRVGRTWKSLADGANDPVYDAGHGTPWPDWQGREAYYPEGVLLWLDVDTLVRERTRGRRSLDDFARAFFGIGRGSEVTRTYAFADVCDALNRVAPYDWRAFFAARLSAHDDAHLFDGLARGGYRLAHVATPTETWRQYQTDEGVLDLSSSLGLAVGANGAVRRVAWNGPAFRAGIGIGATLTSIDGRAYDATKLVRAAAAGARALRLGFEEDGARDETTIANAARETYPALQRIPDATPRLDAVLSSHP